MVDLETLVDDPFQLDGEALHVRTLDGVLDFSVRTE